MTRSLHPSCAGSKFYTPHSAKVPAAYTLISPGGIVVYACDTDCLRRHLDHVQAEAAKTTASVLTDLRRIAQRRGSR